MSGTLKTVLFIVFLLGTLAGLGVSVWMILMYRAFSYNGMRQMSKQIIQGIAEQIGFRGKQVNRIRLSVEEMLTERISHAYDSNGEITVSVILMPHWMRIRFTDYGKAYRLDDKDASMSAKIILANVDAYGTSLTGEKLVGNNLDWQYAEGFDINEYLRYNKEQGKV